MTQPIYPQRRRALFYIGLLVMLVVFVIGSDIITGSFKLSSSMDNKLESLSGLAITLIVIFILPFAVIARRYWQLRRSDAPLPPADDTVHSLAVSYSTGAASGALAEALMHGGAWGVLSWVNSAGVIKLTATESAQTVFEAPFSSVQRLEVNLSDVAIQVNGATYRCNAPGSYRFGSGTFALANLVTAARKVRDAGMPELANRLSAEGVEVKYNEVSKGFEYSIDTAFGLLLAAVLYLAIFAIN